MSHSDFDVVTGPSIAQPASAGTRARRHVLRPRDRHRRCAGEVTACLRRNMPTVAQHNHEAARSWVMLGGRNRIAPANHVEYEMRRTPATMWFG